MRKLLISWLCLVSVSCVPAPALAFDWEPDSVELVASVYGDHLFTETYTQHYAYGRTEQIRFNDNNQFRGIRASWGDNHLAYGPFENSFYVDSEMIEYSHTVVGGLEIGLALSTGYENTDRKNLGDLVLAPTVKYKWDYFAVAQFGGSTQLLVTLPLCRNLYKRWFSRELDLFWETFLLR